jgi:hypothetical protein
MSGATELALALSQLVNVVGSRPAAPSRCTLPSGGTAHRPVPA